MDRPPLYDLTPADLQDLRDSLRAQGGRQRNGSDAAFCAVVWSPTDSLFYLHADGYVWARDGREQVICAALRMARTAGSRWLQRVFLSREDTCEELLRDEADLAARREAAAHRRAEEARAKLALASTRDLSGVDVEDLLS